MIPTGPYPPPSPAGDPLFTIIAWTIVGVIVLCLLIGFCASGGTMKRTTPADLEAARRRRAALHARQAARRAARQRRR